MSFNPSNQASAICSLFNLPCGICDTAWNIINANQAFNKLFNNKFPNNDNALNLWFSEGNLEYLQKSTITDTKDGNLLFRHSTGLTYLIYWWLDNTLLPENLRYFTIHSLPLDVLEKINQQTLMELDSILDFIHDGIWVIDGNGITLRINHAMERIAGIRAEEVVGRHVSEPLAEGRFKTCVTLNALQNKHTVTLFDDYANGKRCLNTSTPIFDANGNVWRVIAAIRDITELDELQNKLANLEYEAQAHRLHAKGLEDLTHDGWVGQSAALQRILQDISKASQTEAVTLILGETGTGKSLAAKTIHDLSSRNERPFVTINCGAIPASLMESELFGYENGAFTGATKGGKPGMLELAGSGTILFDEIGELSMPMQAKLLHILDGQPIYRLGGVKPIMIKARILAATNKQLENMVAKGEFREDLFYRLHILCVEMPPLRQRKDDILILAWHFLRKICEETGKHKKFDPRVERLFLAYSWPGNVRELNSIIQSIVILSEHERIIPEDLPSCIRKTTEIRGGLSKQEKTLSEAMNELEKEMIAHTLIQTGSTYKAARKLGISQSSVVRKAKKYGIYINKFYETTPTLKDNPINNINDHKQNQDLI